MKSRRFKVVNHPIDPEPQKERPAFTNRWPYVFVVVDHACFVARREHEPFGDDWFPDVDGEKHSIGIVAE